MADEEKKVEEKKPETAPKTPTVEELLAEVEKLKKAISASNADASKRKKEAEDWQGKYKATLDEQAKAKLETEEANRQMAEKLAAYEAKERIATYTARLMETGFDSKSAADMASVLPPEVPDAFFEKQKQFLAAKTQEIKTQAINSQPGLSVGMPPANDGTAIDPETANLRRWAGLK